MLREGLASRALKYRAVPVAQRIVDNDKVFRHFCTTMGLPSRLPCRKTRASALSKLPNARAKGRAAGMPAKHDDASRRVRLSEMFGVNS